MKQATIYIYDDEYAVGGSTAAPTKRDAIKGARAVAESGHDSAVHRLRVQGPDLRRLLCALHNSAGYAADEQHVGTWVAGERLNADTDDPYETPLHRVSWREGATE